MSYEFHPAAESEHLESVGYFEAKRAGFGASYLAEFERTAALACESPRRYAIEKKPDIRRDRMHRFLYTVIFREIGGVVQILAVAHHRRGAGYWLGGL